MRRAYFDVGWMLADDGTLLGLSLGYDRCAEHEWGITELLADLGITLPQFPLGIPDRTTTVVNPRLQLVEFPTKPRDRRRKAYPSAMLSMLETWEFEQNRPLADTLKAHELSFCGEPNDKWWKPTDDVVASWSKRGFAVLVRGAENIERLKQVHAAFQSKDIAVAVPWAKSFFRGGLSFVIASRMPEDQKAAVLAQDQAHMELELAAQATGIHETLKAAGKGWYALSPDWYDREKKGEVIFFLNPADQRRANHGWFSVQELTDWCEGRGPVVKDERLDEYAKRPENYDWSCRLLRGMNAAGIKSRYHEKLVWMDEAKTIPGLRHRATPDTEALLPSGDYPFAELMERFAAPLEIPATAAA